MTTTDSFENLKTDTKTTVKSQCWFGWKSDIVVSEGNYLLHVHKTVKMVAY